MISRYLGNKGRIANTIIAEMEDKCDPLTSVCDIFSGSLSMSFEFKSRGYNVIANDKNEFSTTIGKAFIENNDIPKFDITKVVDKVKAKILRKEATHITQSLFGVSGFKFLSERHHAEAYKDIIAVLIFLSLARDEDVPSNYRRTDFFDTYTITGSNSSFISRRGEKGKRNFFLPKNGQRIDIILNSIRYWSDIGAIDDVTRAFLLSSLMRAVEKVSNTQGTYHDFPRGFTDRRALSDLILPPIPMDTVLKGGQHIIGNSEDSMELISRIPRHDLLYIDPPYNFRQYSSYYFMLNLLARYHTIQDYDKYFSEVSYVRGQNMQDDFASSFCKKDTFISSLDYLISNAKTTWVAISYFAGRNHWNDFNAEDNNLGHNAISEYLQGEQFYSDTFSVTSIERLNYQSYGGYKARELNEYLYLVKKRNCNEVA